MSVATLLGLPEAAGLFHRAIAQSGAARNLLDPDGAHSVTEVFLEQLGTTDLAAVLDAPPERILAAQTGVAAEMAAHPERFSGDERRALGLPFQPVVDGVRLPRPALDAVRDGQADVDLMAGTNADEWNLFSIMAKPPEDDAASARRLDRAGVDGFALVEAYRRSRPDATPGALWSAVMTDLVFRIPAIRLLEAQAAHRPDRTFGYWFTWAAPTFDGRLGSCHALEIPFVFATTDQPGADLLLGPDAPEVLSRAMQDAWISFARTGDPHHDGASARWPAYDTTRRATMEFGDRIGPLDDPSGHERELWESIL